MQLKIVDQDDLIYLQITDHPIVKSKIVDEDFNYDFDSHGNVVGIEVINAQHWFGDVGQITADDVISKLLSMHSRATSIAA